MIATPFGGFPAFRTCVERTTLAQILHPFADHDLHGLSA